jgi:hypothetical protein
MKKLLVVALVFWGAFLSHAQRRVVPTAANPLNAPSNPYEQQQIDQANRQWQAQQSVTAAKKAASQAAEFAKQAATYNNQAARQSAEYAAQAATYAGRAATYANQAAYQAAYLTLVAESAASAKQAAADAKKAAVQAEIDSDIAKDIEKLASERDEAVAKLKIKYSPDIENLESQASIPRQQVQQLEQKAAELESQRSQSETENAHLRAKQLFQPKDPWRSLDGKIYNAKDQSWVHFTGRVLEVKPNGILLHGDFGPPLEAGFGERNYFVNNFPNQTYPIADGETIESSMNFVAHLDKKSSTYQYTNTTIDLSVNTVRRLDYGKIVATPPPDLAQKWNTIVIAGDANPQITKALADNQEQQAEAKKQLSAIEFKLSQINSNLDKETEPVVAEYESKIKDVPNVIAKQAKDKEDGKKRVAVDKVVKYNQDLADKGDEYGLLRMGERYRDGDGVEKDLAKAKDYLTKAAAAGSPTAADELKTLPGNHE